MIQKTSWKSESIALVFGALIVFNLFEDRAQLDWVGNLDAIFGLTFWPLMNVVYPLAAVVVFLLYGKSKGSLHFQWTSIMLFAAFLAATVILRLDDVFKILNYIGIDYLIDLPAIYWTVARCLYLFTAIGTFFTFGSACKRGRQKAMKGNEL